MSDRLDKAKRAFEDAGKTKALELEKHLLAIARTQSLLSIAEDIHTIIRESYPANFPPNERTI